jgi:tRNA G37 N-methylase Trm5
MNIDERKLDEWMAQTIDVFSRLSGKNATAIHLEKVKWYCPHIRHVVLDIQIE